MKLEFVVGSQKKALDGADFWLAVDGYFEVYLLEVDDCLSRFDDLSIHVAFGEHSE